ncbi:MAG: hypothetical protein AAF797_18080 [Planctomycetota bacterium]
MQVNTENAQQTQAAQLRQNPAAEQATMARAQGFAGKLDAGQQARYGDAAQVDFAGIEAQNTALEGQKTAGTAMAAVGSALPIGGGALSSMGLLQMQQAIQQQSMMFTTTSNVMKSKHDASMSVVRNIKGG